MKYNILFISFIISILLSCRTEEGCKKIENIIKNDSYNIILSEKPEKFSGNGSWFYETKGRDLRSSKDTVIQLKNFRWYESFYYLWDKGDTLIKEKGSLITEIHKKDTVYYMQWDCDDPKINGISTKLSKPPKVNNK